MSKQRLNATESEQCRVRELEAENERLLTANKAIDEARAKR